MENTPEHKSSWTNIFHLMYKNRGNLRDLLTDNVLRTRIQFFCVFVLFSIISAVMTVMNVVTQWRLLMYSTLFFSVANLINVVLMLINSKTERLSRYLFSVEMLTLFNFFIIFGEPEGFSAIWLAMLPSSGLLLYGLKNGTLLSAFQLIILIFFFWTPVGRSMLHFAYTESFMERFPVLFIAFYFIGAFFEYVRDNTQRELFSARHDYEQLSKHDPLTGLFNRFGFYSEIENAVAKCSPDGLALAIIDFDHFKFINDTFGHSNGDVVLKETARVISDIINNAGSVCRWGGDEFAIFFSSSVEAEKLCESILSSVQDLTFNFENSVYRITVSIGLITIPHGTSFDLSELLTAADSNLYLSKSNGENQINVTVYSPVCPDECASISD